LDRNYGQTHQRDSIVLYVKAAHIIFVVTWFAGLFYAARLMIYQREAADKPEPERTILLDQFDIMLGRLMYIITWPSAILTLFLGSWLLTYYSKLPDWLLLKLSLVLCLYLYMLHLEKTYRRHRRREFYMTSTQLRLYNEIPTIFLVGVVFLVVCKSSLSLLYGLIGLIVLVIILMGGVKTYKKIREKN